VRDYIILGVLADRPLLSRVTVLFKVNRPQASLLQLQPSTHQRQLQVFLFLTSGAGSPPFLFKISFNKSVRSFPFFKWILPSQQYSSRHLSMINSSRISPPPPSPRMKMSTDLPFLALRPLASPGHRTRPQGFLLSVPSSL
jgi:hypothetical protein